MPGPTGLNEVRLNKVQAAIEASRGTALAATRKVYAVMTGSPTVPVVFPARSTGTFDARQGAPVVGRTTVSLSATDAASFEDLPWWFELALKGGVTGTSDSGTPDPAYTYLFVPSLATDDLASVTLEHGDPGNSYQTDQAMIDSWTLRGDPDNANETSWMFEAQMMGRTWVTHAFTGSIPERTTELIKAAGTKVYLDDGSGTIGTTPLNGALISWSISGNINRHYKAFAEDEFFAAANRVGRGDRTVDMQVTLEFYDDVEFANYRASVPVERLIRLERAGSEIHTGTPAVTKLLQCDGAGYWAAASFGDREGNKTVTLTLQTSYDAVAGYAFSANVVNGLAALV